MPHAKNLGLTTLSAALATRNVDKLQSLLRSLPAGEGVRLLTRLDSAEQRELLDLLPAPEAASLLMELPVPQAADCLENVAPERAAALVELFPSNEQADLLAELEDKAPAVLALLSSETAQQVRRLSQYRADTAGGLMVAEFLVFREGLQVSDVIDDLRLHAEKYARLHVQYAYITDRFDRLIGVLRFRDLLLLDHNEPVSTAMIPDPLRVTAEAALDELARLFDRHLFLGIPVVDSDDRLLGVVLRVDVEEATSERAERRMLLMSGVAGGEESRAMPWASRVLRRAPWLCVSLLLSLAAASVIGWYQETLAAAIALTVFLPVISGMGGNSGNQALPLVFASCRWALSSRRSSCG